MDEKTKEFIRDLENMVKWTDSVLYRNMDDKTAVESAAYQILRGVIKRYIDAGNNSELLR